MRNTLPPLRSNELLEADERTLKSSFAVNLDNISGGSAFLKEDFWRHVELVAQALDVLFIQLSFAAQDFRDDAWCPEDAHKIFLPQAMLIHQEAQNVQRP